MDGWWVKPVVVDNLVPEISRDKMHTASGGGPHDLILHLGPWLAEPKKECQCVAGRLDMSQGLFFLAYLIMCSCLEKWIRIRQSIPRNWEIIPKHPQTMTSNGPLNHPPKQNVTRLKLAGERCWSQLFVHSAGWLQSSSLRPGRYVVSCVLLLFLLIYIYIIYIEIWDMDQNMDQNISVVSFLLFVLGCFSWIAFDASTSVSNVLTEYWKMMRSNGVRMSIEAQRPLWSMGFYMCLPVFTSQEGFFLLSHVKSKNLPR